MRITEQKIANIVREEVSRFKVEQNYFNIPNQIFLLKEGKLATKSFDELLKEIKAAKPKQQEKLCEIWYQSSLYEIRLYEGSLDALKKAGKWIGDKASKAWEKVADFFGMKYLQAVEMLKSGIKGAIKSVKLIKILGEKLGAFKKEHPIIFKAALAVSIMIAATAFMALFSSDAHAAIRDPETGKPMSQFHIDSLKGIVEVAVETAEKSERAHIRNAFFDIPDIAKEVEKGYKFHASAQMVELLDKLHQSKETVDFDTIGKISKRAGDILKEANDMFETLFKAFKTAEETNDPQRLEHTKNLLNQLAQMGKEVKGEFHNWGTQLHSVFKTATHVLKKDISVIGGPVY